MLCVHTEITLACLCVFVCGVFVWDRESLSEYWFPPSLSLPQPYCSPLPDSHTLCCLLVRELGCLGVCQAPTVVTLHLCLCIWAPVTLATAFLFLKQLSESLRVSLRVCVFSSLCPNYETPETQPPWGFLPADWCPVCMVYFGRVENWRSLFFPQSKIRLPLCQHTLAFLSLYAAKAHNS